MGESLTDVKVDVAVLQEQYATVIAQLADGRAFMSKIDNKFDRILDQMQEAATLRAVEAERNKIHSRIWTAARHIGTIGITLIIAKILHETVSVF